MSTSATIKTSEYLRIVDYLINNEVDINQQNGDGKTILHLYLDNSNSNFDPKVFKYIIGKGADLNITDNYGETPLVLFLNNDNLFLKEESVNFPEILKHIIKEGNFLSIEDANGATPFSNLMFNFLKPPSYFKCKFDFSRYHYVQTKLLKTFIKESDVENFKLFCDFSSAVDFDTDSPINAFISLVKWMKSNS